MSDLIDNKINENDGDTENNDLVNRYGRKISSINDNPIDNVMIETSEILSPHFKSLNYTPNGITTISLIFAAASLYHLYNYDVIYFAIYFTISYFFDCMDGYYARKYDMVTESGDKYDHFKDLIVIVALFYMLYSRYNILEFPVIILILSVFIVLAMMTVGCQEHVTNKKHKSNTLSIFNVITPTKENCKKYNSYLKYFGTGTLVLVTIIIVFYLNSNLNNHSDDASVVSNTGGNINEFNLRDILDISKPFNGFGSSTSSFVTNPFL